MIDAGELITKWIAPTVGVIIANMMFSAPLRAVLRARQDHNLGELNPLPWAAITGNCIAWIGYSFFKEDWFVYAANQPGFLLGIFYTLTAVSLAGEGVRDYLFAIIIALAVVLPGCGVALSLPLHDWDQDKKVMFWGLLCNIILVIYYSAPLSVLFKVLSTRNAASLHWPTCVMNAINGACWVAYGAAIKDYFILAPNGAGLFLSIIQILLILCFGGEKRRHPLSARSFFFPKSDGSGAKNGLEELARSPSEQHLVNKAEYIEGDNNNGHSNHSMKSV